MNVYTLSSRTGRSHELLSQLVVCEVMDIAEYSQGFMIPEKNATIVSLGYMKRIGASIYQNYVTVNVHPGTLPLLAGRHPQLRALAKLDRLSTDVVLHRVESDEYDTGEILAQQEVKITEKDRDDPNAFFERTRRIGVYLTAAWLIGQGVEMR